MIKLTRGALTMLLAQYRGILKNAWIKNFAVAAALATSVTSAYAGDPTVVATWDDAVKGAVALDGTAGVLNIQADKEWQKESSTIVITGGDKHKIGGEGKDVNLFAENENKDKYPTGNITIDTTGKDASAAVLTIGGGSNKTGVALNSVVVKAGSKEANLTVSNKPASPTPNVYDDDQYTNIQKLTVDGANASVEVAGGKLDVNENLTIKGGASLTADADSILWVGISDVDAPSVNVENGTLTSNGELYIDSSKLTVGEKGQVKVSKFLSLADVGPVNINTLTKLEGDESKAKITLTDATDFKGNDLTLNKKIEKGSKNYVKSLSAQNVTLGGSEYENTGLVADVTVGSKLTASAVKDEGSKKVADTYKIKTGESIKLASSSKEGVGTVASDLEVAGGNFQVAQGTWNAEGLKVNSDKVYVESNAALALKTLEIANGQTLSVATKGGQQDDVAGVLDLTNTKLVNATGKDAFKVQGTIANAGVVKITGEKLQGAIANVKDTEKPENNNFGYIFGNATTGVIEVTTPATLATGAFLAPDNNTDSGIKNAGTLAVDGALTVNGDDKAGYELKNAGTIKAASLQLNGKAGDPAKDAADDSKFTLGAGTYEIDGAVKANTDTLAIAGDVNAQSIGARILEISSTVNAGNVEATEDLKVSAGTTTVAGILNAAKFTQTGGSLKVKGATANIGTLVVAKDDAGKNALVLEKSTATVDSFEWCVMTGDGQAHC